MQAFAVSRSGAATGVIADEDTDAGQRLGDFLDTKDLHGTVDHGLGHLVVGDRLAATGQT
jgi:hypothetical protein